ncbi:MAG: Por secretion system C-terminal sorting domain [Bacteroidetes bacterium HLUCCA01]|nr:MAG: Por secretion system C-terminal sorting domain [Bacteroidetes bacterium HLUCCA01]
MTLEVYTVMGQRVATLASGRMAAGMHSVMFNAAGLSSGMYLYRLTTETGSLSNTMMLIK